MRAQHRLLQNAPQPQHARNHNNQRHINDQLETACSRGNAEEVQRLLELGADPSVYVNANLPNRDDWNSGHYKVKEVIDRESDLISLTHDHYLLRHERNFALAFRNQPHIRDAMDFSSRNNSGLFNRHRFKPTILFLVLYRAVSDWRGVSDVSRTADLRHILRKYWNAYQAKLRGNPMCDVRALNNDISRLSNLLRPGSGFFEISNRAGFNGMQSFKLRLLELQGNLPQTRLAADSCVTQRLHEIKKSLHNLTTLEFK